MVVLEVRIHEMSWQSFRANLAKRNQRQLTDLKFKDGPKFIVSTVQFTACV